MRSWGENVRSQEEVIHVFNNNKTFPDRKPISKSTAAQTVTRFLETGSLQDRFRSGQQTAVTVTIPH